MNFYNYLKNKGFKESTLKVILNWEKQFRAYWLGLGKAESSLACRDLLDYLQAKKRNLSRRSLRLELKRIEHYFSYLDLDNPLAKFELAKSEVPLSRSYLSENDLEDLETLFRKRSRISLINRILFSLIVYQGISSQELSCIKLKEIDLDSALLDLESRTYEGRSIPLEGVQIALLLDYISDKSPERLLVQAHSQANRNHKIDHLKKSIKSVLERSRLAIPFQNLGQVRASRISIWIREKGILKAQYLAGHRHLTSTQAYQQKDSALLRAALKKVHPLF